MNYYVRRILLAVMTLIIAPSITFLMIRLMPGGPMDYLMGYFVNELGYTQAEARARVSAFVGYETDAPLYVQYIDYMSGLAVGDFGESVWYNEPVFDILIQATPWTVFISAVPLVLSFLIGISIGALMAYWEGSRFDVGMTSLSIVATSIPYFLIAIILLIVFGFQLEWFPTGNRYSNTALPAGVTLSFLSSVVYHAILPMLSFLVVGWAGTALSMRGNSIRVLGEDYMRVARLRGLPTSRITTRYVMRNAILPMYTGMLIAAGFIFGGSIITEMIFNYRGLGWYMFRAIEVRDYPLMMGAFIIITVAVVLAVLFADLTYGKIDPRAGSGADRESY